MSAPKAFQSPEKGGKENSASSTSPERKTEKQTSPERKNDETSPERPDTGNVNVKPRRDSGLESNVRSPTGGSFRTAGPDILSAVLGHMSDDDSDDDDEGEQGRTEAKDATESVTSEDTAVLNQAEEKEEEQEATGEVKDESPSEVNDGEDDPETMEEIKLPERGSPNLATAGETEAQGTARDEKSGDGKAE